MSLSAVLRQHLDNVTHGYGTQQMKAYRFVEFLDCVISNAETLKQHQAYALFLSVMDVKLREIVSSPSTYDVEQIRRSTQICIAKRVQVIVSLFSFDAIDTNHLYPKFRAVSRRQ